MMFSTEEACNEEILRIDKQLSDLNDRRNELVVLRNTLRQQNLRNNQKLLTVDVILEEIKKNPGLTTTQLREKIEERLGFQVSPTGFLDRIKYMHRRYNLIDNRGGVGPEALWYIKE